MYKVRAKGARALHNVKSNYSLRGNNIIINIEFIILFNDKALLDF